MGTFCLSFDVEGEWGRKSPVMQREEEMVSRIVKLLEKYTMRATWAIVGKLFREKKNMIALLTAGGHEIACHSYTHPDFTKISKEEAEVELKQCVAAAKKQGIPLTTFVFPFNHVGYLPILKKYGFTAFRTQKNQMYFPSNRKWGRLLPHGVRFYLARAGINRAAAGGSVFHLWTHPVDLIDTELFEEFERILAYADKKLTVRTMNQI